MCPNPSSVLAGNSRLFCVNSGNLYRTITLGCLRNHIDPTDPEAALDYAKQAAITCQNGAVYLEGEDVSALLHSDVIDRYTAPLSGIVPIRHVVNDLIRKIAGTLDVVVEGRDMTTVVFPPAEHRFYLDASLEERAKRRYEQGVSSLSLEAIREAIVRRDGIDRRKAEGSLKIAPGVVVFDTSLLTIEQVYDKLIKNITIEGSTMAQMEVESDTSPMDESNNSTDNIQTQLQEEYLKSLEQLEE